MTLKHSAKRIINTIILILLCTGISAPVLAKQEAPPYKAKTADECIQEKECVWYHFILAAQASPLDNLFSENLNIKRWETPVRMKFFSKDNLVSEKKVDSYFRQLAPFITRQMLVHKKYNYLIMETDNIERELAVEFDGTFKIFFGANPVLKAFQESKDPEKNNCHYVHVQNPQKNNEIYFYLGFVNKDNPHFQRCVKELFYTGFGLSFYPDGTLLDETKETDQYSKIQLFVLLLLYQDEFKSGMSYADLKQNFDDAYQKTLDLVLLTGVLK